MARRRNDDEATDRRVEVAAYMLAADGIEHTVDRHRDLDQPLPGLTSSETIHAEEIAVRIAGWLRNNGERIIRELAYGGS